MKIVAFFPINNGTDQRTQVKIAIRTKKSLSFAFWSFEPDAEQKSLQSSNGLQWWFGMDYFLLDIILMSTKDYYFTL